MSNSNIWAKIYILLAVLYIVCFTSVVILKVSGMLLGRYLKKLLEEER